MPRYLIRGELAMPLGAVDYQLGNELKAVQASIRYENLGSDVLTWKARTVDLEAGETVMPAMGQQVSLIYDLGSGPLIRLFTGRVTKARYMNYGTEVRVEGPWEWLRRNEATSVQSLGGVSDRRPTIVIPQGSVAANLITVANRAIAEGAPFALGSISGDLVIPKQQLSQASYADVLAALLRMLPDAVLWFDYQSNPTGLPLLCVSRRAGMSAYNWQVGVGGDFAPVEYDITPRQDQVPVRTEVKYVLRDATGQPYHASQAAGVTGPAAVGRTQIILLSGREGDTFLPKETIESYTAQTANANTTLSTTLVSILNMLPEVTASRGQFAGRPTSTDVTLANGETITVQRSTTGTAGTRIYPQPTLQFLDATTGEAVSRVGKRFILSPEPPEWAAGVIAAPQKVRIVGRIYRLVESTLLSSTGGDGIEAPSQPSWVEAFPWTLQTLLSGYMASTTIVNKPWARVYLYALDFDVETYLTTSNYDSPRTIYRPQDFEYLAPPSGFAAGLLAAQAFTPHEGTLQFSHAVPQPPIELAAVHNLLGAPGTLPTMAAMARATTLDLLSWSNVIELGAPARFDMQNPSARVRSSPQTNIQMNP